MRRTEESLRALKSIRPTLPTLTFETSLTLHGKARSVQILNFGKAHSAGDVVVYLPKEKVVITGDMLQGWVPYIGDSYPYEWIRALDRAAKLDFDYVIGGHGDVLRGKATFELWKQYIADVMAETTEAYVQGATMKEAETRVAAILTPKYAGKFPDSFPRDVIGNIDYAYRVVSGPQ